MKSVIIALKNLKIFFREKKNLMFTLMIPVFFYLMLGFIFGGRTADNNYIYKIGWVDDDPTVAANPYKPTYNMSYVYEVLDNISAGFELYNFTDNASAAEALVSKKIDAYIYIPPGFEAYLNGSGPAPEVPLTIYFRADTSTTVKDMLFSMLTGTIYSVINYNPYAVDIPFDEKNIEGTEINAITVGTPGYVMYGMLAGVSAAVIYFTYENQSGILKRLELTRVKHAEIIMGHIISNSVIIVIQFLIGLTVLSLFGFSPVVKYPFDMTVGIILTVMGTCLFINALALFFAPIFKTPETAGGAIWIILLPLMMFSGAFFPLEYVAPVLIPYVRWLPSRLTVILFSDLMLNAYTLAEPLLWINLGVLYLEGLLLFILGIKSYSSFIREE